MATERDRLNELRARARMEELRAKMRRPGLGTGSVRSTPASAQSIARAENERELVEGTQAPFLAGAGAGAARVGRGAQQIYYDAMNLVRPPSVGGTYDEKSRQVFDRQLASDEAMRPLMERSQAAPVGEFIGEGAATLPVPELRAAGIAGRALSGAAGGAISGALNPVESPADRGANAMVGAGLGGATSGAMRLGGKALAARGVGPETRELQRLSQEWDVPLTAGELRQSPILQRVETALERWPVIGTMRFRQRQAFKVTNAVDRLMNQFPESTPDDVFNSVRRKISENEKIVDAAFDDVTKAAKQTDEPVIPKNRLMTAVRLRDEEMAKGPDANPKVIAYLDKQLNAANLSFESMRKVRSDQLAELRAAEKRVTTGAETGYEVGMRKQIAQAIEQDIEEWAERAGGDVLGKFRLANQKYVDLIVPFKKDRMLRKLASGEDFDTDTIMASFVKKGRPKLAAKLQENMTKDGNDSIKFLVLTEAHDRAMQNGVFSPLKFANELERLRTVNEVIFSPAEAQQLQGFVKLSRAAERAGQYLENRPTGGNRLVDNLVLGGAIGGGAAAVAAAPKTVGMTLAVPAMMSALLTSNTGKRILIEAERAPVQSTKMTQLMKEATQELARLSVRTTIRGAALESGQ